MQTMVAAVLEAYRQPLAFRDVPLPEPGSDEVRLRVLACGICSTDLHIRDGLMPAVAPPRIMGHEIAGVAEALGDGVTGVEQGARYIAGIDVVCGECTFCRAKQANLCRKRVRLGFERDGGFAQYVIVPARNLVRFPGNLAATQAAILPDAVACMVHSLVDKANVHAGQKTVFIGLGGLAFQGIQIANHYGASVIATSRQQRKQELGLEFGAQGVCDTTEKEVRACARELWGEETADVVIDCVGTRETIALSLNVIRPGGRVVVVGYVSHDAPINVFDLMLNEKEVIGARGSTYENLCSAVKMVEQGSVKPFVSNVSDFQDLNNVLDDLEHGHVIGRSVVTMQN